MMHQLTGALAVVSTVTTQAHAALVGATLVLLLFPRARHDRSFRYLVAMLVLFAISRQVSTGRPETDSLQTMLLNILVIASAYSEVCFFRTALHAEAGAPAPRLGKEAIAAVAVAAVATGAWALAPAPIRAELAQPKNSHSATALVFVTSIIGYYIIVSARVVGWTSRFIRNAWMNRGAESVRPRANIAQVGFQCGLIIIGVAELLRLAADVVKGGGEWVGFFAPIYSPVVQELHPSVELWIRTAHTAFYVGVLIPIVADAVQNIGLLRCQARDYEVLKPLWQAVITEFPDLEFRIRGIYTRFYRREVETRDGLVLLENYYDREVADRARRNAVGSPDEPRVVAALIRSALVAHRTGRTLADPHPLPTSSGTTREEDIAWLGRIAEAFAVDQRAKAPR